MNNLSSYRGLVDAKIRASDKELPVQKDMNKFEMDLNRKKGTIGYTVQGRGWISLPRRRASHIGWINRRDARQTEQKETFLKLRKDSKSQSMRV